MRKSKHVKVKYNDNSYWKSYSDMMAALLLMFILIMTLALRTAEESNVKYEKTVGNRIGIQTELVRELEEELGDSVAVDSKTGDITFESDILYDYNEAVLKSGGEEFLSEFIPGYFRVILSDKYEKYIAEIIIEGHTDTVGGYDSNLKLSQSRALSVAEYIVGEKSELDLKTQKDLLRKKITVTGKSFTEPIIENGIVNDEKSRRVEIKFRLKDEDFIAEMQEIMKKRKISEY